MKRLAAGRIRLGAPHELDGDHGTRAAHLRDARLSGGRSSSERNRSPSKAVRSICWTVDTLCLVSALDRVLAAPVVGGSSCPPRTWAGSFTAGRGKTLPIWR